MYQFNHISKIYDLISKGLPNDLEFYLSEAQNVKGKVLEIACGTGRIFLEMLKNNVDAYGVDISKAMLDVLKNKAKQNNINLEGRIFNQDMKNFKIQEKFDLIIIPYRSFLHNETIEDQLSTLNSCYQHLNPKGKLIINFFHYSPTVVAKRQKNKKKQLMEIIKKEDYQLKIFDKSVDHFSDQKIDVTFYFEEKIKGEKLKKFEETFVIHWIGKREFEHLAERSNFKVEHLYGDFKKNRFENEMDELVWILEKQ